MRLLIITCCIATLTQTGCHKTTINVKTDVMVETGKLQRQGMTTYQYGTHVLNTNSGLQIVMKSSTVSLDQYVGKYVTVTATNLHYQVEDGPALYDATSVVLK
jgi:hypothetical protein